MNTNSDVFERCGLASLSDLESPEWLNLLRFLENKQESFLAYENKFRSPDYKWPRDPLHTWSRIWEYPYVYYHLKKLRDKFSDTSPVVVDLGSGVTFFPFAAAQLGYQIICTDIDQVCATDLAKAAQYVPQEPGKVEFRLINGISLPFADNEADIVYCISVLEHIPNYKETISEIVRILKPDGFLLLTFDIDMTGDSELILSNYKDMINYFKRFFLELYPDTTIHPLDVLASVSGFGPSGYLKLHGIAQLWYLIKQHFLKPVLGFQPYPLLAVKGSVMQKILEH